MIQLTIITTIIIISLIIIGLLAKLLTKPKEYNAKIAYKEAKEVKYKRTIDHIKYHVQLGETKLELPKNHLTPYEVKKLKEQGFDVLSINDNFYIIYW